MKKNCNDNSAFYRQRAKDQNARTNKIASFKRQEQAFKCEASSLAREICGEQDSAIANLKKGYLQHNVITPYFEKTFGKKELDAYNSTKDVEHNMEAFITDFAKVFTDNLISLKLRKIEANRNK